MKMIKSLTALIVVSASGGFSHAEIASKEANNPSLPGVYVTEVGGPVTPHVTNIDLRNMPKIRQWQPGDAIKEVPRRRFGVVNKSGHENPDIAADVLADLQSSFPTRANRVFNSPIINQDGQGFNGVNPPDPVLDVGKNYVIQAINDGSGSKFQILDKTNGASVAGPITMSTLGSGQCATGLGDPIILYDETVERWFMQEFSNAGNFMCLYISKTDNPVTGGWYHYGFSDTEFPDYPHFGVWPNAYIGGANNGTRPIYAFDRANMLTGGTARPMQKFTITGLDGYGFQLATPADWDQMPGTQAPPAGAPAILLRHVDEEAHGNNVGTDRPDKDYLEMFDFTVDWDNTSNSGITTSQIDISDFNSCFINYQDFGTVPQPNSSGLLDAVREAILNRLQYINFGPHESLVGVLPTNITAGCTPVQAGLRWFELRRTGGTAGNWVLHQEGTYATPGTATQNRLVGSISMDVSGNMALAYSMTDVSASSPLSASLKYTGRLATDPLGVMSQAEADMVIGSGANTSGRWGDYAAMAVDPVDGCTFWFTGEYQDGNDWNTRVSAVKFDQCGNNDPGFSFSTSQAQLEVCNANGSASASSAINVNAQGGHTGSVNLSHSPALPAGISGGFNTNPVAIGGVFDATFDVAGSVGAGQYTATILGTSAGVADRSIEIGLNVVDAAPATVTLSNPANGATGVSGSGVSFQWQAITGASAYRIEVATDAGFQDIVINETVGTNAYTASTNLDSDRTYHWRVRAANLCGDGAVSNVFSFTTSGNLCFAIGDAIPGDPAGLDAVANVSATGTLTGLDVSVKASHTWVGDLTMTLSHGGTSVLLMDQPGEGFCEDDDIDALFQDGSGNPVADACQAGSPAIGGTVTPEEALSAFNGAALNGEWVLNVVDQFPDADDGTLTEFCLVPSVETTGGCDPTPPSNDPDIIWYNSFQCIE